jgi:hypothetical protein
VVEFKLESFVGGRAFVDLDNELNKGLVADADMI